MSIRRSIIQELVRKKTITKEQAAMLPTLREIRSAYLACAKEMARRAKQSARILETAIDAKTESDTVYKKIQEIINYTRLASLAFTDAQEISKVKSNREIYDSVLHAAVMSLKDTGPESIGGMKFNGINYYSELRRHMPERSLACFTLN